MEAPAKGRLSGSMVAAPEVIIRKQPAVLHLQGVENGFFGMDALQSGNAAILCCITIAGIARVDTAYAETGKFAIRPKKTPTNSKKRGERCTIVTLRVMR